MVTERHPAEHYRALTGADALSRLSSDTPVVRENRSADVAPENKSMTDEQLSSRHSRIIPELDSVIRRYGVRLNENPAYVVAGVYRSPSLGPVMGVLAAANNEFHAYLIRREINERGRASVERTEYCPSGVPTFSLAAYRKKMCERNRVSLLEPFTPHS